MTSWRLIDFRADIYKTDTHKLISLHTNQSPWYPTISSWSFLSHLFQNVCVWGKKKSGKTVLYSGQTCNQEYGFGDWVTWWSLEYLREQIYKYIYKNTNIVLLSLLRHAVPLNDRNWIVGSQCPLSRDAAPVTCYLTHWGRDKIATISQTTLSNEFSWAIMLETEVFSKGSNWQKKKSALVQVMVWRRKSDKPLSEPMMNQFTDTDMHYPASTS